MNHKESPLYLGSYTEHIYRLDGGRAIPAAKLEQASYLLKSGDGFLLAVSEQEAREGELAAYHILEDGSLKEQSRIGVCGLAPCHIAYDGRLRRGVVSNYLSGNILVFTLDENGTLGALKAIPLNPKGTPPGHAHCAAFTKDGSRFYVCDLKQDAVIGFSGQEETGRFLLPQGTGPRHCVLSWDEKTLYVACELSCQLFALSLLTGRVLSSHDLIDQGHRGFAAAAIRLHPSGDWLALSLRGNDKIIFFGLDPEGGITWRKDHALPPAIPRDIAFSKEGDRLFVALSEGGRVLVYKIKGQGDLAFQREIPCPKAVCICV